MSNIRIRKDGRTASQDAVKRKFVLDIPDTPGAIHGAIKAMTSAGLFIVDLDVEEKRIEHRGSDTPFKRVVIRTAGPDTIFDGRDSSKREEIGTSLRQSCFENVEAETGISPAKFTVSLA